MRSHNTSASVSATHRGRLASSALWVLACASPVLAVSLLAGVINAGVLGRVPTLVLLGVLALLVLPIAAVVLDRRARSLVQAQIRAETGVSGTAQKLPGRFVGHAADMDRARERTRASRRVEVPHEARSGAA